MTVGANGRTVYSILEMFGAILCLLLSIHLYYKLFISKSTSPTQTVFNPTSQMKLLAVLTGIVLCIAFTFNSLLLFSGISSTTRQIFGHFGNLLKDLGQTLFFRYFILSFQNKIISSDIVDTVRNARNAISSRLLLITQILILFNFIVSIIYTVSILSTFNQTNIDNSIKNLIGIIYIIFNLVLCLIITLLLTYLYYNIIIKFAENWKFSDDGFLNDKHHTLLLIMTRFCSLFIISGIIDLFSEIYSLFAILIGNDYFAKQNTIWTILQAICELFNATTYIFAIYFSFSFNNLIYEKYCFCCHNCIYGKAHQLISSQQQHSDYVMMMDPDGDDEAISVQHSLSGPNFYEDDVPYT